MTRATNITAVIISETKKSLWLPSCWNKEEEPDYYCKTKKRQNVKCTAIVISEDNKIDYHCQFVAWIGDLCYIEPIYYYWITGYDYTRRDQLLRLVNNFKVAITTLWVYQFMYKLISYMRFSKQSYSYIYIILVFFI